MKRSHDLLPVAQYHLVLLLLPLLSCCCIAASELQQGDDEMTVLLSIKSALGDPLGRLADWRPADAHYCKWTGVQCGSTGHVAALDLSGMNLTGKFTDSVSHLKNLESLDVGGNLLAGVFPAGLGSLPLLRELNASGNDFTGDLPLDIANATALESLDLRGSLFSGGLPRAYGNLKNLRFLGLSGNNLTGLLPAELGEMTSLETLIIGYNFFEGPIPPELGNISGLRYIDMAEGKLSGPIPPELGRLTKLETVYLYRNQLIGQIPNSIGNLTSLQALDLSENRIAGEIPPELGMLRDLLLLNLMGNRLTGPIPTTLGGLPKLEVLALWNNSLTGPLPTGLGRSSRIQWLDVSTNDLSGPIPAGICEGGNLTKLILFNNAFSGSIPPGLASCPSLVRVRAHNNRLNGTIPVGLGRLPRLQRLELAGNDLEGVIPEDLSSSVTLSFIDVSRNRLRSSLPPTLLSIPTLQTLVASQNQISGGVPDQFQDCPSLTVLDLSSNRLSGGIPASLASCSRLVGLDLSHNGFSGEIPKALATMPSLSVLDLSHNNLSGAIPPNFGTSPALEAVDFSRNNLSGPVPANGVLKTINPAELAGNPGLCGGTLPACPGGMAGLEAEEESTAERARKEHIKHVVGGWAVGISVVLTAGIIALGSKMAYDKWYASGGAVLPCVWWPTNESNRGDWPWRLTAFQRLSFTSAEVLACVKESNIIGAGATGVVYRADLPRHHAIVAVKKLHGGVDAEDIEEEVTLLGRLRHRNIVRLLGTLHGGAGSTMLVYEYMPNGSLWDALHGARAPLLADWVSRYNVAVGVAQGLAYLHHDCRPPVIHRDVKSSNILLDAPMEGRIADFGLARILLRRKETVTAVAGSHGYIAPEYGYTLKVDEKSDIYSYGVVLMELLTGRKPTDPEFDPCQGIVGWVRERLWSNRGGPAAVEDVLDSAVGAQCAHVQEEMMLVLRVAVLCTARSPRDRPSMRDVLTMLSEAKPRRKSGSSGGGAAGATTVPTKEKPVFSPSTGAEY